MWIGVILSAVLIYHLVRTTMIQTSKEILFTWFLSLMLTLLGIYTVFQYFSMIRDMNAVLAMVAILINKVAEMGAGFLSMGALYQPEIPEELKK
jgi:cyclic lactone autoinducer peptide